MVERFYWIPRTEMQTSHLQKMADLNEKAINGSLYFDPAYWDGLANDWGIFTDKNLLYIFPVAFKKKWSISYVYMPIFLAHTGILTEEIITEAIIQQFISALSKQFKFIDIVTDFKPGYHTQLQLSERVNYILPINGSNGESLVKQYRKNTQRNIQRAKQFGSISEAVPLDEIIRLSKLALAHLPELKEDDFDRFEKTCRKLISKGKVKLTGFFTNNNQLVASAAWIFANNRWYYLLVGNHPNSKTMGASHALISHFIEQQAGTNTIIDFEGSDIRNLAFFYEGFGAIIEKKWGWRINTLPWYIKLFKS